MVRESQAEKGGAARGGREAGRDTDLRIHHVLIASIHHVPNCIPSETATALFARCLWCSFCSPEPTFTPWCEQPKHPGPKHPVGLPAGSPAQTPCAAMTRR